MYRRELHNFADDQLIFLDLCIAVSDVPKDLLDRLLGQFISIEIHDGENVDRLAFKPAVINKDGYLAIACPHHFLKKLGIIDCVKKVRKRFQIYAPEERVGWLTFNEGVHTVLIPDIVEETSLKSGIRQRRLILEVDNDVRLVDVFSES